jgi:hypothetical protein
MFASGVTDAFDTFFLGTIFFVLVAAAVALVTVKERDAICSYSVPHLLIGIANMSTKTIKTQLIKSWVAVHQ